MCTAQQEKLSSVGQWKGRGKGKGKSYYQEEVKRTLCLGHGLKSMPYGLSLLPAACCQCNCRLFFYFVLFKYVKHIQRALCLAFTHAHTHPYIHTYMHTCAHLYAE